MACEKKEEISVMGIPYPLQTYQVIDIHAKAQNSRNIINKEFEGFQFSIDLNRTSKEQMLTQLNKAIDENGH